MAVPGQIGSTVALQLRHASQIWVKTRVKDNLDWAMDLAAAFSSVGATVFELSLWHFYEVALQRFLPRHITQ